ncbi:pirin family protein [Phaeodactylibacter xiamenensis]|jgi:redox-sensitive bicupin YhaK (pirin superfamily)|uniref:pirin family protein n=1 Tax=Phaeodactylibacter xiamenensis TaxID=1524460 RepID=UPI0024A7CFA5|nr:pirin family protein [Phaeodactylibacter xiamenensis]
MKYRSVAAILPSEPIEMGQTMIKQPLPTVRVERIDPFLLLHHFGPYEVTPPFDPLDVGPHPHRGFEPVTFLYQGELRHKDSRGNEGILGSGDVQWMTAGRGIIHSERASRDFLEQGGVLEGVQLWINLPRKDKMVQPDYQNIKSADIPTVEVDGAKVRIKVVAGHFNGTKGPAQTRTELMALQVSIARTGFVQIPLPPGHNAFVYIVNGKVQLNDNWSYDKEHLIQFRLDGEGIALRAEADSEVLLLSGLPIGEPVAQWGPYVMNTQTEIMEAMRDYQMGKMGFYTEY